MLETSPNYLPLVYLNLRFLHTFNPFLMNLAHSNFLLILHPTQQQVARGLLLLVLWRRERVELLVMPLPSRDVSFSAVREHALVLSSQEICDRVAVLGGVQGYDSVDARLHGVAAREAERVAHVDDCGADFGSDEAEFLGC